MISLYKIIKLTMGRRTIMKKLSLTTVFGLIGALSWGLTVLLRGTSLNYLAIFYISKKRKIKDSV